MDNTLLGENKMTGENYSLADIGALMNNRGYGDGFGGGAWWIIILFFLVWGNNWNRNGQNQATTEDVYQSAFDNRIMGKLDGINNGLCDGFYAQNTNLLQGFNGVQRDLCQGFSAIGSQISENRFAAQNCCCETNRNIDAVRYENSRNTCDIVRAIEKDGEETRKLIVANQLQDLRDRLAMKDQELQTANFQLYQQAQSANIISTLQPVSKPAYITCSPYESAYYGSRGFNGGCGCGY